MNLDVSTYPQILADYLYMEIIVFALLTVATLSFISVMTSFISSQLELDFWENTIANQYPIIAQGISTGVTLLRLISFAFISVHIVQYLVGDMEILLLTVATQSVLWMAIIFLLTEVMLVMTYGPKKQPQ